ncbi:hypothetical protein PM082_007162 [Marasmius tenuissimus]|nr:hypothetical protein PM082_007162 [Marasmius tenuissimus]
MVHHLVNALIHLPRYLTFVVTRCSSGQGFILLLLLFVLTRRFSDRGCNDLSGHQQVLAEDADVKHLTDGWEDEDEESLDMTGDFYSSDSTSYLISQTGKSGDDLGDVFETSRPETEDLSEGEDFYDSAYRRPYLLLGGFPLRGIHPESEWAEFLRRLLTFIIISPDYRVFCEEGFFGLIDQDELSG